MNALRWTLPCTLLLAATGCRVDPAVALLEQENTLLEDKIFDQQSQLERYRQALQSCRRENAALREQMLASPPNEILPGPPIPGWPESAAPQTLPDPDGQPPESDARPPQNTRVKTIALVPSFTGGLDMDRHPGDDGISLLIQPLDRDGHLLQAIAPVSVVLLDPASPGEAARVARWDLSAEEVAQQVDANPRAQGLYLEMAWPGTPPGHPDLRLYARYTTGDGRKLVADTPVHVDLADRPSPTRPSKNSPTGTVSWREKPATTTAADPSPPVRPAAHLRPPEPAHSHQRPPARPTWSPNRL